MLLLLRTPATGLAAASLGISLGLAASGAGVSASLGITLGLTPPEAIELQVVGLEAINFGLTGVPTGFQAGAANLGILINLSARGGFGATPTIPLTLGLTGTVGSFFDGIATVSLAHGLSGAAVTLAGATVGLQVNLSGTPIISGGTISSAANLATNLGLSSISHALGTSGLLTLVMGMTGSGFQHTASVVESMSLTLEGDSMRMFFRKK